MENGEMKFKELTYKIIGCAMEVHKVLGIGYQEYRTGIFCINWIREVYIDKTGIYAVGLTKIEDF